MPDQNNELVYQLNDRPGFVESLFVALQHLLAIFMAIITPPLIICGALKLDVKTTSYIVSMSLFASGISTFIQVKKIGPIGSGLLSLQGTSFSFLGPIIMAGQTGGLSLIFGVCFVGSFVEIILSRFLKFAKKIINPLVSGIVVTLIGATLIKVSIISAAGGYAAKSTGNFASYENLGLATLVLLTIVLLNRSKNKYVRMSSIIAGLTLGYAVASIKGLVDYSSLSQLDLFNVPTPFKFGFDFSLSAFIPIVLIYLITTIEAIGDLTATSMVSREPIKGPVYQKRISDGVLGDGFNSCLASIFNSFPNATFSQNNGIIQLTGVASRYIGYFIAGFLVLFGLFPVVGGVFSLMPAPVLGGATILMFGTVAAAGIKIIASEQIDRRAMIVMALAFGLGFGVESVPEVLNAFPEIVKNTFKSGITTGGLTAIIANLMLPPENTTETDTSSVSKAA